MEHYYATYRTVNAVPDASDEGDAAMETLSEFDKHCEALLSNDTEEGWSLELRRYLKTIECGVKKDTDIVEWWQVCILYLKSFQFDNLKGLKDHADIYPTLARIALDVLPAQASFMPCERLFSGTKQVATDCRASLGPVVFEEVTITKSAWGPGLCDVAAWNATQVEEVEFFDYEQMLVDNGELEEWDQALQVPGLNLDWD